MSQRDDDYHRGLQAGFDLCIGHLERKLGIAEARTLRFQTARIAESASAVAEEIADDIQALTACKAVAAEQHARLETAVIDEDEWRSAVNTMTEVDRQLAWQEPRHARGIIGDPEDTIGEDNP